MTGFFHSPSNHLILFFFFFYLSVYFIFTTAPSVSHSLLRYDHDSLKHTLCACVCLCDWECLRSVYISCGWVAKASAVTGCQCDLWAHHTLSEPASHTDECAHTHTQNTDRHTHTHIPISLVMVGVTSLSRVLTSPKCIGGTKTRTRYARTATHTHIYTHKHCVL